MRVIHAQQNLERRLIKELQFGDDGSIANQPAFRVDVVVGILAEGAGSAVL